MTLTYLRDQRHREIVAEIARAKFPFPTDGHQDLETVVNEPTPRLSVGKDGNGKDLFPDIVVVGRPGQWLRLMAEVETADSVTDDHAQNEWLPYSRQGELLIYVPVGWASTARQLCRKYGVKPAGIRTWRFRPVWGLDVTDA